MTSSSDFAPLLTPELRSGDLTRFGETTVLGDAVTEHVLAALVEDARQAARAQGYSVGWAEGRRAAAVESTRAAEDRERIAAAEQARWEARQVEELRGLRAAALALGEATHAAQSAVHAGAVGLALELTETMVGHELRRSPDTAADVVARVLAQAPSDTPFELRVHPGVAAVLAAAPSEHPHGSDGPDASCAAIDSRVQVVADAALGPADAVVVVREQLIDLRISAALERVRAVLT